MNSKVSRRHFLQRAGCLAIGATALTFIGNGQTMGRSIAMLDSAQVPAKALSTDSVESWLLDTGLGEIDPAIYTLLTTAASLDHKIFLPTIQQQQ